MFGFSWSRKIFAAVALALAVAALPLRSVAEESRRARHVFLMIGDGMGAAQRTAAHEYLRRSTGGGLVMESLPYGGLTTTDSVSGVTDSAAAGTAIACGVKTKNGMVGVTPDGKTVESLAADAKKKGMRVAIITDVPLNHATPAAFYAHCGSRGGYSDITGFLPGSEFDIFVGDKFLLSKGGAAPDGLLSGAGYKILNDIAEFASLEKGASKVVFLMTIPYAIQEPGKRRATLAQTLEKTISLLESKEGFFIALEGGRIDWACHNNDIATAVMETLAFDAAVRAARDFQQKNESDTLIVVTTDHETGALETAPTPSFARLLAS